jgi:hypothetical protein
MMKPTLYVHCGFPKTGTTSLQNFLKTNQRQLIERGWLYPNAGIQGWAHHPYANFFRNEPLDWVDLHNPKTTREALRREIEQEKVDNVIISSEALISIDRKKRFRTFFSDFQLRVVIFVRRQDEWIESVYQEVLKTGADHGLSLESFLKSRRSSLDYYSVIGSWAEVVDRDGIIVAPFEASQIPNGIEETFCSLIHLDHDGLRKPPRRNERLNRACLFFLSNMSDKRRIDKDYFRLRRILQEHSKRHPDNTEHRYFSSPKERIALLEWASESNANLAREYLGRLDGRLFYEDEPDLSEPWKPYPGPSSIDLVQIAEALWKETLRKQGIQRSPPRS